MIIVAPVNRWFIMVKYEARPGRGRREIAKKANKDTRLQNQKS